MVMMILMIMLMQSWRNYIAPCHSLSHY